MVLEKNYDFVFDIEKFELEPHRSSSIQKKIAYVIMELLKIGEDPKHYQQQYHLFAYLQFFQI